MAEKLKKVSLDDLRSIPVGDEVTFKLVHPKLIDSVRSMAYRLNASEPELKKRLTCKSDFANRTVTVKAEEIKAEAV